MPWVKGQSGNPRGGNKRDQSMAGALRTVLREKGEDGRPNAEAVARKVFALAISGNMDAIKLVFDRLDGPVSAIVPERPEAGQVVPFTVTIDRPNERAS